MYPSTDVVIPAMTLLTDFLLRDADDVQTLAATRTHRPPNRAVAVPSCQAWPGTRSRWLATQRAGSTGCARSAVRSSPWTSRTTAAPVGKVRPTRYPVAPALRPPA